MTAIDVIRTRAAKYSGLTVVERAEGIGVRPTADGSFEVGLSIARGSYIVSFDGWHEACPTEASALELFAMGLSDAVRLRVTSRGGQVYRWTAEFRHNDDWRPYSTTGLLLFRFWNAPVVRYLQNHVIPAAGPQDEQALILPRECRP